MYERKYALNSKFVALSATTVIKDPTLASKVQSVSKREPESSQSDTEPVPSPIAYPASSLEHSSTSRIDRDSESTLSKRVSATTPMIQSRTYPSDAQRPFDSSASYRQSHEERLKMAFHHYCFKGSGTAAFLKDQMSKIQVNFKYWISK